MDKEYTVNIEGTLLKELGMSIKKAEFETLFRSGEPMFFTRALVDHFNGLKVEIFSQEHPPPHFRVKYQESTANFRISDCYMINGSGAILKREKEIKNWWKTNKQNLIDIWNIRRPSNCPVGIYRED